MSSIRKPPKLKSGDTIGIAAPAAPLHPSQIDTFERGIAGIRKLGLEVALAPNALVYREYLAVSPQQRAADLNHLFADPNIRAIFCAAGGWNAHAVLPLLDWAVIEQNPKIIMGYSNITALLMGIAARTNLVTFHGPVIFDGFGEYPELLSYTREQIEAILFDEQAPLPLQPPSEWTDDYPHIDQPRAMKANDGWHWLKSGKAQGHLCGGNLQTMRTLVGTPYWPTFNHKVLFVEEVNMRISVLSQIHDSLVHLQLLGVFDQIAGLIMGKINELSAAENSALDDLITEVTMPYDFPILTQVDFGHTAPQLVLPLGVRATLDSAQNLFQLEEAGVIA